MGIHVCMHPYMFYFDEVCSILAEIIMISMDVPLRAFSDDVLCLHYNNEQ